MRLTEEYVKATTYMREEKTRQAPPACSRPGLHTDETELVEFARQGNAAAFGEIYDRHVSLVYRYAYALLGNKGEAENLTAETFFRALQAIRRYRWTRCPLSSWLLSIARNLGMRRLRRTGRTKHAFCFPPAFTCRGPAETESAHGVNVAKLNQAFAVLSPVERETVVLRFVLNLDYVQVAQVVGKSVDNVRVIQYRALRNMYAYGGFAGTGRRPAVTDQGLGA